MSIYCTDLDREHAKEIESIEQEAQEKDTIRQLLFGTNMLVLNEHLQGLKDLLWGKYGNDLHADVYTEIDKAIQQENPVPKRCLIFFALYLESDFLAWVKDQFPSEEADYHFRAILPNGVEHLLHGHYSLMDWFTEMLFQYASRVPRYVPASDQPNTQ